MDGVQALGALVAALAAVLLVVGLAAVARLRGRPLPGQPAQPSPAARSSRVRPLVPRVRAPGGWTVHVEVALLVVDEQGRLRYRTRRAAATTAAAPDQVALELAELPRDAPGGVVRATSWRYEDAGHLVLTYAAMPCEPGREDLDLAGVGVLCSDDPLRPAPAGLHEHHVVAHAARHLDYLAQHDQTVRDAARRAPAAWAALHGAVHDMPVTEHLDGHELARRWLA